MAVKITFEIIGSINFWEGLHEFFEKLISGGNTLLWGYVLIAVLLKLDVYFPNGSRFAQARYLKEMFRLLKIKEKAPENTNR
ncbi:hypothetical protein [Niallia taxi]|uniref:hypothetical protein n=1 Tax=Niallia taxi TaxID=2499688 RepID=UPI003D2720F2